ncbi:MAG: hypothetical protein AAFX99_20010, partial [Myxococcota bacterium]
MSACSDNTSSDTPPKDLPASDAGPADGDQANMCAERETQGVSKPNMAAPGECPSGEFNAEGMCLPSQPSSPQPVGWDCPAGWSSTSALSLVDQTDTTPEQTTRELLASSTVCLPPELPESCPQGQMAVLGQGCVPLGMACPQGDEPFHDVSTLRQRTTQGLIRPDDPSPPYQGQVWYVLPGASGDGSREQPWGTIAQALEAADDGDLIALGAGEYLEEFSVQKQVAIVGACVQQTTLRAPDPDERRATVRITSRAGTWLSDVTITGERPGIAVGSDSQGAVHLQSVVVEYATATGVLILGARDVRAADMAIHHTQPRPSDRTLGYGLSVQSGGVLEGERLHISHNYDAGLFATDSDTQTTFRDLIVTHTQPQQSSANYGWGVCVQDGAVLEGERLLLSHNHDVGLFLALAGARATVEDLVITHTQP